jgi:hypothetical protein
VTVRLSCCACCDETWRALRCPVTEAPSGATLHGMAASHHVISSQASHSLLTTLLPSASCEGSRCAARSRHCTTGHSGNTEPQMIRTCPQQYDVRHASQPAAPICECSWQPHHTKCLPSPPPCQQCFVWLLLMSHMPMAGEVSVWWTPPQHSVLQSHLARHNQQSSQV